MNELKKPWIMSGIPILQDNSIRDKVERLHKKWKGLLKNKNRTSNTEKAKRDQFTSELDIAFNISSPDAETKIQQDRLRSETAKGEDIKFLQDQLSVRKMYLGKNDEKYEDRVYNKLKRQQASTSSSEETEKRGRGRPAAKDPDEDNNTVQEDLEGEPVVDRPSEAEDFVEPEMRKRKPKTVTLEMPTNILEKTADR